MKTSVSRTYIYGPSKSNVRYSYTGSLEQPVDLLFLENKRMVVSVEKRQNIMVDRHV